MDTQAYQQLVSALALYGREVIDTKVALMALERVLERENPPLHKAYAKEIESLKNQRFYETNLAGLQGLCEKLSQG